MRNPPGPDCYDYVRRYYHVPAYIGVRVKVGDREGVLVDAKSSQQYLHILLDGERWSGVYHPTDHVEYLVERRDGETTDGDDQPVDVRGGPR